MFRVARTVSSFVGHKCHPIRWYSTHAPSTEKKITLLDIAKKHREGTPLTMVTAYDYTSAFFVDKAAVDVILVGDSLGMVMLGRNNTTEVTMDEMLHHCKAVARGTKRAFVVGDLPFGSFEVSPQEAVRNACRLVKEGAVSAVKLEGGKVRTNTVRAIVDAGIPVIGHVGLTPQTAASFGGFRVQGKSAQAAASIFEDALALQEAGCSALVIEFVPELLGQAITKGLTIPTFGIGAGRHTSGQVLVYHDMLGMYPDFTPKFCKQFANIGEEISKGLTSFKQEVESHQFPATVHTFSMKNEEWDKAHDLILQSHPNKEGVDQTVAKALAQVKASLAATTAPAIERSKSLENSTASSENSKTTETSKTEGQVTKPTEQSKSTSSSSSTPITNKNEQFTPRKTVSSFVTNFDLYYNSYIQNHDEDEKNQANNNNTKRKMKV